MADLTDPCRSPFHDRPCRAGPLFSREQKLAVPARHGAISRVIKISSVCFIYKQKLQLGIQMTMSPALHVLKSLEHEVTRHS